MKHANQKLLLQRLASAGIAGALGFFTGFASAGPLNIADNALEIATGVEPNVMVLTDDSGSMFWSTMVSTGNQGRFEITSPRYTRAYSYVNEDATNSSSSVVPTQNALNLDTHNWAALGYSQEAYLGVWRARNHNFNTVFYNPDTTYIPWRGVDSNGNAFANVNPASAPVNPYYPTGTSTNLTQNIAYTSRMPRHDFVGTFSISENVYRPFYYTWTDTDGDGFVDHDDAHSWIEIRTSGACTTGATCPGSFARAGTRTDCGGDGLPTSSTTCTAAQELQNFANYYSYYRRRELSAKAAITRVLNPVTGIRVGMATINNNNNVRIPVASLNSSSTSGNKRTLFDRIFRIRSTSGTPLRRNLERVGNYFACDSYNIFGTSSSSPGSSNCPMFASPAGECQQNYTILMTDGFWNGSNPGIYNADGDGNNGGTPQGPFDGASFADGTSRTLADVAMHYYERDLQGGLNDLVPVTSRDRSRYVGTTSPFEVMHQHMATFTVGFGVTGNLISNPLDVNANPATFLNPGGGAPITGWPTPAANTATTIDDLRHAAWNGRGDFLSASDQTALTQSLQSIFNEIQAGTGAASTVAFNATELQSGAAVFRAQFDLNTNAGTIIANAISIDGQINLVTDLWDAGKQLNKGDSRKIITYDADTNTGVPFLWNSLNTTQQTFLNTPAIAGGDGVTGSTAAEIGENRLIYLRGGNENFEGINTDAGQFRVRGSDAINTEGVLGDIVHSSPVFVGQPQFRLRDNPPFPDTTGNLYSEFADAFTSRDEMLYIGANDGMLHGFDAVTGEEEFAYVPNVLFPKLSALASPDYQHQFYVDMNPAVNDVYFTPTSGTNSGSRSWNTVLVGGLGAGGPGYFALNVTDPSDLMSEASAAQNVMWEFTQADDVGGNAADNLNLGVSIFEPLIAMTNIPDGFGNNRWAVIFGNGYNSASTNGDAELYIAFIDGGLDGTWTIDQDFFKLSTGVGKNESADGTTPNSLGGIRGIDVDQNGTVDVVYAGDYQGNVYRFNLGGSTISQIKATSSKPVQKLFTATYGAGGTIQPITNRPIVIKHPTESGFIVVVGTGSYFTNEDTVAPGSEEIQSVYGLWDDFTDTDDSINEVNYSRLLEQEFLNVGATVGSRSTRGRTDYTPNWAHNGSNKHEGWVLNLDAMSGGSVQFPGEKAVREFRLRGNTLFVNSVIPRSSVECESIAGGFRLAFNPETGGRPQQIVFDINNDGVFDADDNVGGSDAEANIVSDIRFDGGIPTGGAFIGNREITQTSDRNLDSIATDTGGGSPTGRHSWRQITVDE